MTIRNYITITFSTDTVREFFPDFLDEFKPHEDDDSLVDIDLPPWIIKDWCKCENLDCNDFIQNHAKFNPWERKLAAYVAIALIVN